MPRTKEANEFVRQKRIKQILSTSLRLYCLKGIANVTMDEIAKNAKVSHGLVYHYFKDKEEICKTLIEEGKTKFEQFAVIGSKKEGAEFFEFLTKNVIEALKAGEEYAFYCYFFLSLKFNVEHYDENENNKLYQYIVRQFQKAQDEGKFQKGDSLEFMYCYFTLLITVARTVITSKKKSPKIPSAEVIMNLLYK